MLKSDKEAMLQLIDIVRDLNKSLSMLVDNADLGTHPVLDSIMNVAVSLSNELGELTNYYKNGN